MNAIKRVLGSNLFTELSYEEFKLRNPEYKPPSINPDSQDIRFYDFKKEHDLIFVIYEPINKLMIIDIKRNTHEEIGKHELKEIVSGKAKRII